MRGMPLGRIEERVLHAERLEDALPGEASNDTPEATSTTRASTSNPYCPL